MTAATLDSYAATACVPEPLLRALRYGMPARVVISGVPVMVIATRPADTTPNPGAEVDAWDRITEVRSAVTALIRAEGVPAGRVEYRVVLPAGVAALGWQDGAHDIVCVPPERHLTVVA